jgi:hypothetical protein
VLNGDPMVKQFAVGTLLGRANWFRKRDEAEAKPPLVTV